MGSGRTICCERIEVIDVYSSSSEVELNAIGGASAISLLLELSKESLEIVFRYVISTLINRGMVA